jgi:dTDP-4-amino-4,6-dideoxygalactose transaminase
MTSGTEAQVLPLIELGAPTLGEPEKQALADVIDDGWLTMGERVRRFEREFATFHGAEDAVAVASATAALQLSLAAFDIGPGDEVLVPSMSFVATAAVVVHLGATPVFVDIQDVAFPHLCLDDAKRRITPRTRAIIVMHYGGNEVDLKPWRALADEHGLLLFEDAAHASGLPGLGTLSHSASFSFFSNKNMTTAEGGMIILADPERRERARLLRAHGMTASTLDRDRGRAVGYDVVECGHNFRMDELRAALGIVQLTQLAQWNETRRQLVRHYRENLSADVPEVTVPFDDHHRSTAHIMSVLLPEGCDRQRVMKCMREDQIQTSVHYPPIHEFDYYCRTFSSSKLPLTEAFGRRELTLPLHARLTNGDVDRVVATLKSALTG